MFQKLNSLNYNKITSYGAGILFDRLRLSNSIIKYVCLGSNPINDECIRFLGEYIKSNIHLESIDISNSRVSDKGIEILAQYLNGNTSLICLDLFGNKLVSDTSFSILVKMIETSHMQDIDINETLINQKNEIIIPLVQNILKYGFSKLLMTNR